MSTDIKAWLDFSLQQMAAESYLDQFVLQGVPLQQVLIDGNNDRRVISIDQFTGKTQFTNLLAQQFTQRYQIVDHHANDATGFSATLMRERDQNGQLTNNYTLSFRSTEFLPPTQGGDWERDGIAGADGEIVRYGFSLAQLVSMEKYYQELKANPAKLPVGAVLNVTGYSLGGHLATVFTELHDAEVTHTYAFNGAGRGTIVEPGQVGQPEAQSIRRMLQDLDARIQTFDPTGALFRSGAAGNIYQDDRYQNALSITRQLFTTVGTAAIVSTSIDQGAFQKITQLHGSAVTGSDFEFVANSGIHATPTSVLIEGQPNWEGRDVQGQLQQGNTHSLTLLVDSLALQELFHTVDPTLTQAQIEGVFKVASNATAQRVVVSPDTPNAAEGNTLEQALDALRMLFLGPNLIPPTLPVDSRGGGFGNLANRNTFYEGIATVKTAVIGGTVTIEPLVQVNAQGNPIIRVTPSEVIAVALEHTDRGLAYRYALRALNPFAVVGADYLALGHTAGGRLSLYDTATGFGELTVQYISDRAAFLLARLDLNLMNSPAPLSPSLTHYVDVETGLNVPSTIPSFQREYLFGGTTSDTLHGSVFLTTNDHLYGGGGNDALSGFGGDDYLQGDSGNDRLDGSTGSDALHGGLGFDTYVLNPDGMDVIEDGDQQGVVQLNNQLLLGGIRKTGDPEHTYKSLDNQWTFVQSGATLTINGTVTIQNWQPGTLGITLRDLSTLPTANSPAIEYNNGLPTHVTDAGTATVSFDIGPIGGVGPAFNEIVWVGSGNDVVEAHPFSEGHHQFHGGPGNDDLYGGLGHDRLWGEAGEDWLVGGDAGDDMLDGGADRDVLIARAGQDHLLGGGGDDLLLAGTGRDTCEGGEGNDTLLGSSTDVFEEEADYLDGGAGADYLWGGQGDDVLLGGEGNDRLRGDSLLDPYTNLGWQSSYLPGRFAVLPPEVQHRSAGGADFLDGGQGDDTLYGDGGSDVLLGGTENDLLYGDNETVDQEMLGDDLLDGGAGNDQLYGGGGHDRLIGGSGADTLLGDFLNDPVGGGDWLDGGTGDDTLAGGQGNDVLFGGADVDTIFGNEGEDVLDGGGGNDVLHGGTETDVLWGGTGTDLLFGDEGNDQLFGGDDNDLLSGDAGADELVGGADDDTLQGGDGEDILIGGVGDDVLQGGAGNDTYVFNLGDGVETINDALGTNRLVFGSGVTSNDVGIGQGSLLIRVGLNGDLIHIENFNPADPTQSTGIESFEFADGTTLTHAQLLERGFDLVGTNDSDVLDSAETYQKVYGLGGNDVLTGGSLNNLFYGGTGNDQVSGNAGDDQLFGEAGSDTLNGGTGNDVLIGGVGADRLRGGAGQDRYLFSSGDGADTIVDTAGEGNRVVFGAGISAESVTLEVVGEGALAIHTGQLGDRIQIIANLAAVDRSVVDIVEFADGSTLSIAQLLAQGITFTGTADGDVLTGTAQLDRISGLGGDDIILGGLGGDYVFGDEGNDQLFGGDGNDTLDGGSGSDVLDGGAGADTYAFGRGSGQDVLSDSPVEQGGPNIIRLTGGVFPDDVHLQARRSDDRINVVLTIEGSSDELTLSGLAAPSLLPISEIRFADGTSWDMDQILNRIDGLHVTASAFGSELNGSGFRDELIGDAGNDVLNGLGQADRMVGGDGDDWYWVDHAGDAVVETTGKGTDVVFSFIDYILPDYVEDLLLWRTDQPGADPVRGEGNASANLLIGNGASNVLIGKAGDDILYGGFGDDELFGGAGIDTYVAEGDFNGFDTIYDVALPGEGNRLQFGTTMRPGDVMFVQEGSHLMITNSGAAHGVILADFDPTGVTGSLVTDVVAFSSGVDDVTGGYEIPLLVLMTPTLGTTNAEMLVGTANVEVINTGAGDDTLAGGAGNDVLIGGTGNDTYVFNQGDGFDLIDDQPGVGDVNRVQFGVGITQEMLQMSYGGTFGVGGLSVRIGTSGDGLHFLGVSADDPNSPHAIDKFYFADGSQLSFAQLFEGKIGVQGTERSDGDLSGTFADDRMEGFAGSESLSGQAGNDILEGGTGNDVLSGGEGEDTYVFNVGDGIDRIEDETELIDDGQGGHLANNRILFGPGISLSDLSFVEVHRTIRRILVGSNGDSLELPNFVDFPPGLRTISFSDGLTVDIYDLRDGEQVTDDQTIQGGPGGGVLIGGSGDDFIRSGGGNTAIFGGAGSDTLVGGSGHTWISGGPGNDLLLGGSGGNTFLLSPGSGRDSIQIPNYLTSVPTSRIQFGGGYGTYNPSLSLGSLVVRYGTVGDEIHIVDFDPNNVFFRPAIQSFEFSDRTLSYEELIALGFDINGTSGNDVLIGTNTTDRMVGLAGDDDLSGGIGADTFTGGQGNDILRGGAGHDSYLFNVGDGIDTVEDLVAAGEGNRIQFGVGVSQSDLTLTQNLVARTLTIQVGTSGADQLIFRNFDPTGTNGSLVVETLAFADGSTASLVSLLGGPVNHAPTVATPIADHTVQEDISFSLQIPANTFADQDAGDRLTYSASLADGTAFPNWLSFNAATRTFSGTPDDAQVGSLDLKVTATDGGNLSDSDTFSLTVQNVNDAPTVVTPLADQTTPEDASFSFVVPVNTFSDIDAVDTLTYSAMLANGTALPSWLSFNATTRTLSGTPVNSDVGVLTLAVKATDNGNLSATSTFGLKIQNVNDAPTAANLIPDQQTMQGTEFSFVVAANTFADVDVGDTLTYSATLANGNPLPVWLSFNATTRTFSGTPGNGDAGVLAIKVMVTDTGVLSAFDIFDLRVNSLDQVLMGTAGNDVLIGGMGNDQLFGLGGNDTLTGMAGNDVLDGGAGPDTMTGGTGNDTYVVNVAGDVVTELANEGTDTVQSGITYALGNNVENLTLTGTGAINGTGNPLDNVLTGNSANNTLTGGAGNDRLDGGPGSDMMVGGTGDDTYVVNQVGDMVTETANQGTDTVESSVTFTLGSSVENLILAGTANINGIGSSANNLLTGNSGNNTLDGGSGNDTATGGAGNDILLGGSGNDVLNGGDGVDTLDGGSGDDQLFGGTGNDTITGGSGADLFTGGTGNDTMTGWSGNDVYRFLRGDGQDTIIDVDPFPGNHDRAVFGATINPLDLVLTRQVNDLRIALHGTTDSVTIQNWYANPTTAQVETIQAGNGQALLNGQVDQLIRAMAAFTQQTGLTWDQGIDQRPQDVQAVLAGSWQ